MRATKRSSQPGQNFDAPQIWHIQALSASCQRSFSNCWEKAMPHRTRSLRKSRCTVHHDWSTLSVAVWHSAESQPFAEVSTWRLATANATCTGRLHTKDASPVTSKKVQNVPSLSKSDSAVTLSPAATSNTQQIMQVHCRRYPQPFAPHVVPLCLQ